MSTFSKGDKVRVIDVDGQDPQRNLVLSLGEIHTVEDVTRHGWPKFGGHEWLPERFEKVEPEWVVGQEVSEGDYERLPVGSVVEHSSGPTRTKVADNQWRPDAAHLLTLRDRTMTSTRTLTHLPDATQPEDATDAYVEPEPLNAGDWVQAWAQLSFDPIDVSTYVRFTRADGGAAGGQWVRNDAIVRPDAGQVPPWVKPVEEPTTLGTVVTCEEGSVFVRVHAYGKQPWGRSGFNEFRSWDEIPTVERVDQGGAS